MSEQDFLNDVSKIYEYLENDKNEINKLITALEDKDFDSLEIIKDFAKKLDLELSDNLYLALITRLVNLRDDTLVQVLKKLDKNENEIIDLQEKAYDFVRKFHENKHKNLLN